MKVTCMLVREETGSYPTTISGPVTVARWFKEEYGDPVQEHLVAVFFDTKHQLIDHMTLGVGTMDQCIANPRDVLRAALLVPAATFVLLHNHPSGMVYPSPEDRDMTRRFSGAAKIVGIPLLDHLIVGHDKWYSMELEEGGEL